jgi:glycosyltransferase involved in cell wall biosynthesis
VGDTAVKWLLRTAGVAVDLVRSRFEAADISIFHEFVPPPYGGGNQFLIGLRRELEGRGWRVATNRISPVTRACLFNSFNFDAHRLEAFRHAGCRMVHRVDGPVSLYRGVDEGIDRRIREVNQQFADATVFQSEYSLQRHVAMGLTFKEPHVIRNAADPSIFHPRGRLPFDAGRRVRLIATSWSDNVNKGADIYAWLDEHLDWSRYEFTFLGRTTARFRRIRVQPPVPSPDVAEALRAHDIYVIASRHEPCSNALLEALSCGLPAVYLDSGSHAEVVGEAGVPFTTAEEAPAAIDRLAAEHAARQARIAVPTLADTTDRYLAVMQLPPLPGAR